MAASGMTSTSGMQMFTMNADQMQRMMKSCMDCFKANMMCAMRAQEMHLDCAKMCQMCGAMCMMMTKMICKNSIPMDIMQCMMNMMQMCCTKCSEACTKHVGQAHCMECTTMCNNLMNEMRTMMAPMMHSGTMQGGMMQGGMMQGSMQGGMMQGGGMMRMSTEDMKRMMNACLDCFMANYNCAERAKEINLDCWKMCSISADMCKMMSKMVCMSDMPMDMMQQMVHMINMCCSHCADMCSKHTGHGHCMECANMSRALMNEMNTTMGRMGMPMDKPMMMGTQGMAATGMMGTTGTRPGM